MSNLEDRKQAASHSEEIAARTKAAMASIERNRLRRERNGAAVGMAAGGFGTSITEGRTGIAVKAAPIVIGVIALGVCAAIFVQVLTA